MACGEIKFLEGGVIKDSNIVSSKMTSSTLNDCTFDAGRITNLKSIDSASTKVVSKALCDLPLTDLTCVAKKIQPIILTDGDALRLDIDDSVFKNGSITNSTIKNSVLTDDEFKSGTITTSTISDSTINGSTFKNGTVSGTTVSGGTLTGNDLKKLASCDSASAKVIAAAMGNLAAADVDELAKLMQASVLTNGVLLSSVIKTLQSIDATSAGVIADAIGNLSAAKRKALGDKLLTSMTSTKVPDTTTVSSLPTKIFGDSREGFLGAPDVWFQFGNYLVPGYTIADGSVKV